MFGPLWIPRWAWNPSTVHVPELLRLLSYGKSRLLLPLQTFQKFCGMHKTNKWMRKTVNLYHQGLWSTRILMERCSPKWPDSGDYRQSFCEPLGFCCLRTGTENILPRPHSCHCACCSHISPPGTLTLIRTFHLLSSFSEGTVAVFCNLHKLGTQIIMTNTTIVTPGAREMSFVLEATQNQKYTVLLKFNFWLWNLWPPSNLPVAVLQNLLGKQTLKFDFLPVN